MIFSGDTYFSVNTIWCLGWLRRPRPPSASGIVLFVPVKHPFTELEGYLLQQVPRMAEAPTPAEAAAFAAYSKATAEKRAAAVKKREEEEGRRRRCEEEAAETKKKEVEEANLKKLEKEERAAALAGGGVGGGRQWGGGGQVRKSLVEAAVAALLRRLRADIFIIYKY
jgi:hypothetical protein